MADTRVQRQAAEWVRERWLPEQFSTEFENDPVQLVSGGQYRFDAVSADRQIVAAISTSAAATSSGKLAVGKLNKIRADMFFLLLSSAKRRVLVFTERDMYERCLSERDRGRVPEQIEFVHAQLPREFRTALDEARELASKEVRPRST